MKRLIRPIRIEGDIAYITLTKGHTAIIDADKVHLIEGKNWGVGVRRNGEVSYARGVSPRAGGKQKTILLHRVIMGIDDSSLEIDHINHDTLDNRRANLRTSTHAENQANRSGGTSRNTSGFRGVFQLPSGNFQAQIKHNRKLFYLGSYKTKELASAAFEKEAQLRFGEFYTPKQVEL